MDKDNSNSISIEEIVDYMLLHGRFDLGTKSQRDFSTAVLRKLGNDHMNKSEFQVNSQNLSKESYLPIRLHLGIHLRHSVVY